MRFWFGALVIATVLASAARADAMCAPELWEFWVGTPDGSTIPTRGSLYVYSKLDSSRRDASDRNERVPFAIEWVGEPGTVEQEEVGRNVFRVSYQGEPGNQLVLRVDDWSARYTLTNSWRAPTMPPTVLRFDRDRTDVCCEFRDVLRVTLDQLTAAVRIRWTIGDATSEWILPAGYYTAQWPHSGDNYVLEIGERSRGGSTVPGHELELGGKLELFAIREDGSEVPVRGIPSTISFHDFWTARERAEREAALLRLRAAKHVPRELPPLDTERPVLPLVLLLAGFGFGRWWLRRTLASLS